MSSHDKLESETIRWARLISLIGLVGLLILAVMTVGEVLLRWLFDFPILGVADGSSLVITVSIASCFPLVFAERRSITVRVLGVSLGHRANTVLEAFGSLVVMIVFCLITWQLWVYTNQVAVSNQTTWVMLWPVAPWYRIATVLIALCIPAQAIVFFNQVRSAFGHK